MEKGQIYQVFLLILFPPPLNNCVVYRAISLLLLLVIPQKSPPNSRVTPPRVNEVCQFPTRRDNLLQRSSGVAQFSLFLPLHSSSSVKAKPLVFCILLWPTICCLDVLDYLLTHKRVWRFVCYSACFKGHQKLICSTWWPQGNLLFYTLVLRQAAACFWDNKTLLKYLFDAYQLRNSARSKEY